MSEQISREALLWGSIEKLLILVVGSFLFVGLLEEFKSHEAFLFDIRKTYVQVREKRNECHKLQNDLYLTRMDVAGGFLTQAKELPFLLRTQEKVVPEEYMIYMGVISKLPSEALDKAKRLSEEKNICNTALNVLYEDLALLLGKHKAFMNDAEEWAAAINATTSTQKREIDRLNIPIDYEFLSSPFRYGIEAFMLENASTMPELMKMMAQAQTVIAEKELERLKIDEKLFMDYRSMILPEMQLRMKAGFIAWLFT
ncbi:MAG: hypothetical protein AB2552_01170 [Candidatus Thiodiazotropha endolucinida]